MKSLIKLTLGLLIAGLLIPAQARNMPSRHSDHHDSYSFITSNEEGDFISVDFSNFDKFFLTKSSHNFFNIEEKSTRHNVSYRWDHSEVDSKHSFSWRMSNNEAAYFFSSFYRRGGWDLVGFGENDFDRHHFDWGRHGNGNWCVQPVPEPETYVMMLAGLLLVGHFTSRQHKKS